ncbi:MAG: GFA family protein [Bdellovibrionota bacterium]
MIHRASCICGQLSLSYDGEIKRTSICHCFACQRRTGSVFGVQTRLDRTKVKIEGRATKYDRPTDEGDAVHFSFCPVCGSNLFWEVDDLPESIIVGVGAFNDTNLPSPVFSVYENRKHHWVELPKSVQERWD